MPNLLLEYCWIKPVNQASAEDTAAVARLYAVCGEVLA